MTAGSDSEPTLLVGSIVADTCPHHRTIQQVWQYIDAQGQLAVSTNSHIELASGPDHLDNNTGRERAQSIGSVIASAVETSNHGSGSGGNPRFEGRQHGGEL